MSTSEFDRLLAVLENPIRRRIIHRLSESPSYPLEISGDLGVHQQLITKHLKVMEDAEVVDSEKESSPHGPDRRMYDLTKSMSLTIDFAPDLYAARMFSFEDAALSQPESLGELNDQLDHLSKIKPIDGINPFAKLIADIDKRVDELEVERVVLLNLRSMVMREAKECIKGKGVSLTESKIIHHILNNNQVKPREISGSLDMGEEVVTRILDRLKEKSILR